MVFKAIISILKLFLEMAKVEMKEKIPIPPLNLQPSTGFAGWKHIIRQRS